jgi:hypothetical protein
MLFLRNTPKPVKIAPMSTPTQRSLARLRKAGYIAEVVERWNPHARVRHDLWGFIDILCIKDGETLGVQTTTKANMRARERKIVEHENYPALVAAGWAIHVHGWVKVGNRWQVEVIELN